MSIRNLALIVQEKSIDNNEYEVNAKLVDRHLAGLVSFGELPQLLKDALYEWEMEEWALTVNRCPESWETYEG